MISEAEVIKRCCAAVCRNSVFVAVARAFNAEKFSPGGSA
jgi:hypothetical protein